MLATVVLAALGYRMQASVKTLAEDTAEAKSSQA
jgi:hypothetical protein